MSNKSTNATNQRSNNTVSEGGKEIMFKLLEGPATLNALGVSRFRIKSLVDGELVHSKGTQRHVIGTDDEGNEVFGRGRPANVYALTSKGRSRAKRLAKKIAEQSNDTAPAEAETAA